MSGYALGQTVWVSERARRGGQAGALTEAVVTKVGRKWVTIKSGSWREDRFNPETGDIDGGDFMSPGRVWRDPEEWRAATEARVAWDEMLVFFRNYPRAPPHLSAADINRLLAELREPPVQNLAKPRDLLKPSPQDSGTS